MFTKYIIILVLNLYSTICFATDIKNGKELFKEAACMECHNKSDFKIDKKKTSNFKKLSESVQACQTQNDAGWFDDESSDVSNYLNHKYYKFKH